MTLPTVDCTALLLVADLFHDLLIEAHPGCWLELTALASRMKAQLE